MFCPNCGSELPEGARFCGACGAGLAAEDNPPAPVEPEYDPDAEATLLAPDLGFDRVEEKPTAPKTPPQKPVQPPKPAPDPVPEAAAVAVAEPDEKPKKKNCPGFFSRVNKVALIGVIAVVVVAILAAVLVKCVFFRAPKNAFLYFSNGKYQLMTSTEEDSAIKLANAKSDYVPYGSDAVKFTEDGKYVYFLTKYDSSTYTGTLNRAQYGKLKQNSDKNDKYIETVDSNVYSFTPLGNGSVVYKTGDSDLYYFDGKDTQRIAKEIKSYGISGDDKRLIYSVQNSRTDWYDLYAVELKSPEEREKIVEDAVGTYNTKKDLNHILYTLANEDEDRYDLYVTDFAGESKLLAENVSYLTSSGEKYYYTVQTGSEPLYDYVADDCATADAGLTQPNLNDYSIPNNYYYTLSIWSDPDAYDTIYTSCTHYSLGFYGSMEDDKNYYEGFGSTQGKAAALESFINKYQDKEDSDGYLEVTDEVKRDLMLLAQNLGYTSTFWTQFCYYKYQSGYTYDYDAYYEAYDRYSEAADRISLRESLKDPENDLAVYSICCYDSGTVTTLAENVVGHELFTGGVAYRTLSEDMEKVDIMNLSDVYSFYSAFSPENIWDGACIDLDSATAFTLSDRVKEDLEEMDYVSTAILDGQLYAQSGDGIFTATVDDGAVEELVEISDEGSLLGVVDGKAYYGIFEDDTYFDLYVYDGKDSARLARDIRYAWVFEDGALLVFNDDDQYAYLSAKGEKTVLYEDSSVGMTFYRLSDKSTLYHNSDGELYHFDGKESTRLARNVDRLWVKDYVAKTVLSSSRNPF